MTSESIFERAAKDAKSIAGIIDYTIASVYSKLVNTPTIYKGKGRPKKSDYALYEHPLDKKITREINRN